MVLIEYHKTYTNTIEQKISNLNGIIKYKSLNSSIALISGIDNKELLYKQNFIRNIQDDNYGELNIMDLIPPIDAFGLKWPSKCLVALIDGGMTQDESVVFSECIPSINDGCIEANKHADAVSSIIKSIANGVKFINIKVTSSYKGKVFFKMSDLIVAIDLAVQKGSNIINLSLGAENTECRGNCVTCNHIDSVATKYPEVLFIAAAGNNGPNDDTMNCPAKSKNVISVGGVDSTGNVYIKSSRGHTGEYKPDLVTSGYLGNSFGTSYSSAIITGVCSALFEKYKDLNIVKNKLFEAVVPITNIINIEGRGLLSIDKIDI